MGGVNGCSRAQGTVVQNECRPGGRTIDRGGGGWGKTAAVLCCSTLLHTEHSPGGCSTMGRGNIWGGGEDCSSVRSK